MAKAKSQFACDPRVICALRARQNYKLAPRERECFYSSTRNTFSQKSREAKRVCSENKQ